MTAFYNEIDPYAAAWLRNLIAAGLIAPGEVDERSIVDIRPSDLAGFDQCHFFAGIGGWSYALRLAGVPDDFPVWTGSCPCQPFSAAGKQRGEADERHLWPVFRDLIAACRPAVVFGEQVASALGREWLARVCADLEDVAYALGAADLCAAGKGAPHIRQRLWWVADADGGLSGNGDLQSGRQHGQQPEDGRAGGVGDPGGPRGWRDTGAVPGPQGEGARERFGARDLTDQPLPAGAVGWSAYDIVHCTDGKARRFEPGSFPLAHGVPARVGRLRAYGNAIVPQVAAEFIGAFLDSRRDEMNPKEIE